MSSKKSAWWWSVSPEWWRRDRQLLKRNSIPCLVHTSCYHQADSKGYHPSVLTRSKNPLLKTINYSKHMSIDNWTQNSLNGQTCIVPIQKYNINFCAYLATLGKVIKLQSKTHLGCFYSCQNVKMDQIWPEQHVKTNKISIILFLKHFVNSFLKRCCINKVIWDVLFSVTGICRRTFLSSSK